VQKGEHTEKSYLWLLNSILIVVSLVGCSSASPGISTSTPITASIERHSCLPERGISVSTYYVYYGITGSTPDELRAQMDRFGYTDELGHHWDAYTKWDVHWSYPYSTTVGGCATGPVEVEVEVVFVLPQWDDPEKGPVDLAQRWNTYLAALQRHEDGHKDIAVEAGCEVLRALDSLAVYASCSELEQTADAIAESTLELYRQHEDTYDRQTDHGAMQGVGFP